MTNHPSVQDDLFCDLETDCMCSPRQVGACEYGRKGKMPRQPVAALRNVERSDRRAGKSPLDGAGAAKPPPLRDRVVGALMFLGILIGGAAFSLVFFYGNSLRGLID